MTSPKLRPEGLTQSGAMQAQGVIGNRAVARMFSRSCQAQVLRRDVVQRAGPYKGLLPEHDTYGEGYTFRGAKSDKFTYHHIIPENRLHLALKKLTAILDKHDAGEISKGEANRVTAGVEAVKASARDQWLATRALNLTSAINRKFKDFNVVVTDGEIKPLVEQHSTVDPLFQTIRTLVKDQIESRIHADILKARNALRKGISQMLNTVDERDWLGAVPAVVDRVTIDGNVVFDAQGVANAIKLAPAARRGSPKGNIVAAVEEYAKTVKYDQEFWRKGYLPLYEDKVSSSTNLKKVVRDEGLPKEDQDELADAITWIPGNIHRGPEGTFRLSDKSRNFFDELVDDGGDAFEKAAANLVNTDHYERLVDLNEMVEELIATPDEDLGGGEAVTLAANMLQEMHALQEFGLTQFNSSAWKEETVENEQRMRLVRNEPRLKAAAEAGLLD